MSVPYYVLDNLYKAFDGFYSKPPLPRDCEDTRVWAYSFHDEQCYPLNGSVRGLAHDDIRTIPDAVQLMLRRPGEPSSPVDGMFFLQTEFIRYEHKQRDNHTWYVHDKTERHKSPFHYVGSVLEIGKIPDNYDASRIVNIDHDDYFRTNVKVSIAARFARDSRREITHIAVFPVFWGKRENSQAWRPLLNKGEKVFDGITGKLIAEKEERGMRVYSENMSPSP